MIARQSGATAAIVSLSIGLPPVGHPDEEDDDAGALNAARGAPDRARGRLRRVNQALTGFVRDALRAGHSRDEISAKLAEAGWPEDEIAGALAQWAEVEFPVPVPRPRPYLSAREAFVYLVLFSTLYTAAIALGRLLFALIERALPDPAVYAGFWQASLESVRWSTASVLIAFPVYLWLSGRVYLAIRRDPEKRTSKVRKWLTYITLFVAAGVLIGDLITLLDALLGGELTLRFLLKSAVAGAIAGAVFGFYLWDLRRDDLEPADLRGRRPGVRIFTAAVTASVAAAVVGGLLTAGSPGRARARALDAQRLEDLQGIALAIDLYWTQEKRLPRRLRDLEGYRGALLGGLSDPAVGKPYPYEPGEDGRYALCAEFALPSDQEPRMPPRRSDDRFWSHPAGPHCFEIEARDRG